MMKADWNLDRFADTAGWHRATILLAAVGLTALGVTLMATALLARDFGTEKMALLALFALGFGWIALSFVAAVAGFILYLLGLHPVTLRRRTPWLDEPLAAPATRTAIVMPIYNEEPQATFARIAATWRSLEGRSSSPLSISMC